MPVKCHSLKMLTSILLLFSIVRFSSANSESTDVEISEATSSKKKEDFINSENPYIDAGRQLLYTNDALVKNTQALFGQDCNLAWNLEQKEEINFTSPNYGKGNYPSNFSCHLSFTGSELCIPVLSCEGKIDLRSSLGATCSNEYLLVTDGVGGEQRWCGGMTFLHPVKATGDARDLFVKIKTSTKPMVHPKEGFRCTVKCGKEEGKDAKSLEKVDYTMKTLQQCICGIQNKEERIVGGLDTLENEFPWIAALVVKGSRSPVCGASLINDRWILTASHCFFNTNYTASDLEVLLHSDLLDLLYLENADIDAELGQKGSVQGPGYDKKVKSDKEDHSQRFQIEKVIIHPLYTKKYDYDVALVQLKHKLDLKALNAPTPICLPRIGNYKTKYAGLNVTVAGWGKAHEKAGGSTRKLQKLEGMPIIDFEKCEEMLPKYELTDRMLCAGFIEGSRDACTGDSGGPLIYEEKTHKYRQIGIVSFGSGCARKNSPGIYTKLTELSQWIIYHANQVNPLWCRDSYF